MHNDGQWLIGHWELVNSSGVECLQPEERTSGECSSELVPRTFGILKMILNYMHD